MGDVEVTKIDLKAFKSANKSVVLELLQAVQVCIMYTTVLVIIVSLTRS